MAVYGLDADGAVRSALQEIARDHGYEAFGDARLVAALLSDLLATSPRETELINAATRAGVARRLMDRIDGG